MRTMKAAVFVERGRIVLEERPVPEIGPNDALVRVTTTTICGTDVHILKGEYPVDKGRIIGHEPVGTIAELGAGVTGYAVGQRVIVGAITPCGQCNACLGGQRSQCGGKAMGGWRFGNTIDGCQAEYLRVPFAMANLCPVPDGLTMSSGAPIARCRASAGAAASSWMPGSRTVSAPSSHASRPAGGSLVRCDFTRSSSVAIGGRDCATERKRPQPPEEIAARFFGKGLPKSYRQNPLTQVNVPGHGREALQEITWH